MVRKLKEQNRLQKFKTILFDFDGTLIDTNKLIYESFRYTLEKYDFQLTDEEILQFNGPPLIDTFTKLNPSHAVEMVEVYQEHNLALHNDYVTLFPNVFETLTVLREKGIRLGIVSTKMKNAVELGLTVTRTEHFFDSVITLDDVEHAKPHPEPVLKGMNELAGDIRTTLMVGDNYHDIKSGQHAGVHTAGVAWSVKGETYLQKYNPTFMLQDMNDLLTIIGV